MKSLKLLASIASFIVLIISCKKGSDITQNENADRLYETFISLGIPKDKIVDLGAAYVIYGDILFEKDNVNLTQVRNYFLQSAGERNFIVNEKGTLPRSSYTNNLVSSNKVETIRVYNAIPSQNYEWDNRVFNAFEYWGAIPSCKIDYYFATGPVSSYDIMVQSDANAPLPDNYAAVALFPSNNNPGWRIRVNTDYHSTFPGNLVAPADREANFRYNLAHEIGHTLGFRHTNWQQRGEPISVVEYDDGVSTHVDGANLVPGTSQNDPASIMNGGTANNIWNGFSAQDIIGAQFLYPYTGLDNWLTYPNDQRNGSSPRWSAYPMESQELPISWNPSLVNTDKITLQLFQGSQYIHTIASNLPNTGTYYANIYNVFPYWPQHQLQVKIIDGNNPANSDMSVMFYGRLD